MSSSLRGALTLCLFPIVAACASGAPPPDWNLAPRPAPPLEEGAAGPQTGEGTPDPVPSDESFVPVVAPETTVATEAGSAGGQVDDATGAGTPAAAPGGELPADERAADGEAAERPAVAWVAGTPVSAGDLLAEWYWVAGRDVWLVFDKLVAMRLATLEAQRLGVRLAPEAVELRVAEENRRLATEVATLGDEVTIEDYLRQRYGFEPQAYFRQLRTATIRQMVAERVVRAWTLDNEWARLRLLVVESPDLAAELQGRLSAGESFAELAREHSLDDTREAGGLVPFLVRQENSPLARLAFVTPVGEVAGPLDASGHQALVLVESKHAPLADGSGTWSGIGQTVEASLSEFPLTDSEFMHWKLTMERRYPVDAEPLEALLGLE